MSRFPHLRRRQDRWSDEHAHARTRLAERLDGPLGLTESTWLDEHLAACPSCTAIAAAFEDDRVALRALRDQLPEPPRDLWARTAAAIEAEASGGAGDAAGPARRSVPVGAMSGIVVVAIAVGVTLLSGTILFYDDTGNGVKGDDGIELPPGTSVAAVPTGVEATPFAVDAGAVGWIDQGPNARRPTPSSVDEVCPVKGSAGCPTLETDRDTAMAFDGATKTIVGSPTRRAGRRYREERDGGRRRRRRGASGARRGHQPHQRRRRPRHPHRRRRAHRRSSRRPASRRSARASNRPSNPRPARR